LGKATEVKLSGYNKLRAKKLSVIPLKLSTSLYPPSATFPLHFAPLEALHFAPQNRAISLHFTPHHIHISNSYRYILISHPKKKDRKHGGGRGEIRRLTGKG
jgi:hypothetical protein